MRKLIGRSFIWEGQGVLLVELLEERGQMVFQLIDPNAPVQADQYGNATCRQQAYVEVDIFNQDGCFRAEVLELLSSTDR